MSGIVLGLALALIASVALNSSYVLQHVGSASAPAIDPRRPIATLVALFRSRLWALGAALGIAGWVTHIGALSHAPLSLVQAFVAGGLGLMAPVASRALGQPLAARERAGVVVVVVALVMLCLGLGRPGVHGSAHGMALAAFLAFSAAAAGLATRAPAHWRSHGLGLAGGALYGAADVAVKALTGVAHHHGAGAVLTSPWLAVAALTTAAAFFSFQRGLQTGRAVPVIVLMTAGTTVVSIVGGFVGFGDPIGRTPALAVLHVIGFVLVTVAAAMLAPAVTAPPAEAGAEAPSAVGAHGARELVEPPGGHHGRVADAHQEDEVAAAAGGRGKASLVDQ